MDDGVIRPDEHVIGALAGLGGDAADKGRRRDVVAGVHSGFLAHVAVVAGLTAFGGGRVLEFAEGLFKAEAIHQRHIVAGSAEGGLAELETFLCLGVDLAAGLVAFGDDAVFLRLGKDPRQFLVSLGAVDWFEEVALDEVVATADLAVGVLESMTDDAGDALAGGRVAVLILYEDRFAHVHAHLVVATDAEVAVGAGGLLDDGRVHRVEHRAHLRVGVRRDRPFPVMVRMAGPAGRRRGESILREKFLVLREGVHRRRVTGVGVRCQGQGGQGQQGGQEDFATRKTREGARTGAWGSGWTHGPGVREMRQNNPNFMNYYPNCKAEVSGVLTHVLTHKERHRSEIR